MSSEAHNTHDHDSAPHAVPLKYLAAVLVGLLILTVVTVWVSRIDLGEWNVWVAILVATAKASLVGLFFMHLRWDSLLNSVVLVFALIFVALFIIIPIADSVDYSPDLRDDHIDQSVP